MPALLLPDLGKRPLLMGILNITPDSFSGDGLLQENDPTSAALRRAEQMLADGADVLDIGGESSRPGSVTIDTKEEIRRVIPVLEALRKKFPSALVSIDTVKPDVAGAALQTGVCIINDISGTRQDPAMLQVAAKSGVYLTLMHNRSKAHAVTHDKRLGGMYEASPADDIVENVRQQLFDQAERAIAAGVARECIILDPGYGFGKTIEQNLRLINELDKLKTLGFPLLAGPSRKSFIGRTLNLSVSERLEGTAAAVVVCVMRGAAIVRVHDVKKMARVVKMTTAIVQAK